MEGSVIVSIISALCCVGGVVYMVVEKLMDKPKTNAEIKQMDESVKKDSIDTGLQALQFHQQFEEVIEARVEKAVAPVLENQERIVAELRDIKENWCCYRDNCNMRIKHKDMILPSDYEEN